jgi:hypothetical protein
MKWQKYITTNIQFHKSCRKYKSENGRTRTSGYIRGGIRCHEGVSIPVDRSHPPWTLFPDQVLLYIRRLSCKFELCCLSSYSIEDFKRLLSIETHIKWIQYRGRSRPPRILINLILHCIRKLSCNFKLFWIIGSWEQDF